MDSAATRGSGRLRSNRGPAPANFLLASMKWAGSLTSVVLAIVTATYTKLGRFAPKHKPVENKPMKMKLRMRQGFTLVELLVVIVIIAALAGLTAPMVIKQRKKADQTEAVNNARQIGFAMFEFENEYASYPDRSTADAVQNATGSPLSLGSASSNDFFRQLIAANLTQVEKMFYAKVPGVRKPDEDISAGKALSAGEVGFGYLMNGDNGFSAAGNPNRPLVVTPLLNNATDGKFDPDPFDAKAIVLKMDNSVTSINIRQSDNTIVLGGTGTGLLSNTQNSVWGTNVNPRLVAPLLKGE